jgi:hypothetical protein
MAISRMFPVVGACASLAATAPAANRAPTAEVVPAAQLRAYVATTASGLVSHAATIDPASRTLIVRRDALGEVEVHALLNDVLVGQAGAAILVIGGRIEGGREVAPDERRGGTIIGGRSQAFGAGDVAWIPAGIPHQMVVRRGSSLTYVAVKTDRAARAH